MSWPAPLTAVAGEDTRAMPSTTQTTEPIRKNDFGRVMHRRTASDVPSG